MFSILVREEDMDRAVDQLCRYVEENPPPVIDGKSMISPFKRSFAGIWMALCLCVIYIVPLHMSQKHLFRRMYDASSEHILSGELYRGATALFLHQDAHHLLANMLGMSLFGSIVCSMAGWGWGSFLILCSGIVGNLMTAVFYGDVWHRSIGASTAVFGAVGIFSGMAFRQKVQVSASRFGRFMPLASAVVFLGFFSAGEHTDIMAHLFGLVAGIVLGCVAMGGDIRDRSGKRQIIFFCAALSIVGLSFLSPLCL